MAGVSRIHFVVVDLRCFTSSLAPSCEAYFHAVRAELRSFVNRMIAVEWTSSEQRAEFTAVSFLLVTYSKVEVRGGQRSGAY